MRKRQRGLNVAWLELELGQQQGLEQTQEQALEHLQAWERRHTQQSSTAVGSRWRGRAAAGRLCIQGTSRAAKCQWARVQVSVQVLELRAGQWRLQSQQHQQQTVKEQRQQQERNRPFVVATSAASTAWVRCLEWVQTMVQGQARRFSGQKGQATQQKARRQQTVVQLENHSQN